MTLLQRVTALEQVIIQQNTHRLDRLEQSAIEADKRLTRLENLAERAENRLDRLEKAVADNTQAIASLQKAVAENTEAIKQLSQRVDRLEVKVDQNTIAIEKLGQRVDRLEVKVDRLEVKVDRLEVKVNQLEVKVDQLEVKVDQLRADMNDGFKQLTLQISNLGSRWGVQNESIWRQTIASLLEKSYGVTVQRLDLGTEEIDVLVSNGDHILIEMTSRFHQRDVAKVTRKRQLYTDQVQAPSRFIVAAAAIHSKVTQQLMGLGFEVIEPEID